MLQNFGSFTSRKAIEQDEGRVPSFTHKMSCRALRPALRGLGALRQTRPSSPSIVVSTSPALSTPTPRCYATAASRATLGRRLPDDYVPPTQPPSARPSETRKSQLLRTYTSLLRSSPLMLMFQHNNLTAVEWAAVRRELRAALRAVPPPYALPAADGTVTPPVDLASKINIQVVRTNMLDVAMRITEVEKLPQASEAAPAPASGKPVYNHDLSKNVWNRVQMALEDKSLMEKTPYGDFSALLTGPIAVVAFPDVSPSHLAAVLKVLAPKAPAFPAPTRKASPGYWDPSAQAGFQKLLLVGGRVEDQVFDVEGVRWVGGIDGGLDSLRAQVIHLLQSAGMGLAGALEGAGKSLWFTLENRKAMLEEEEKGPAEGEAKPEEPSS